MCHLCDENGGHPMSCENCAVEICCWDRDDTQAWVGQDGYWYCMKCINDGEDQGDEE